MDFSTRMRLPAEHTSPWLMKTPNSAPSMAASKSAWAKKMLGDLPPSSRVTRLTVSSALFERAVNGLLDQNAPARGTHLALVDEDAEQREVDGGFEIGVGEEDVGRLAAQIGR